MEEETSHRPPPMPTLRVLVPTPKEACIMLAGVPVSPIRLDIDTAFNLVEVVEDGQWHESATGVFSVFVYIPSMTVFFLLGEMMFHFPVAASNEAMPELMLLISWWVEANKQ